MAEIVIALDMASGREALALLDRLPGARWVKVGSVLMTREGPELVRELSGRGLAIFLDLKWHDIPSTVAGAVDAARDTGIAMVTVHTLGGLAMMRAAQAAAGPAFAVVGVTVLTSHDDGSFARVVGRDRVDLHREVGRLAGMAMEAGLAGIVCSPHEARVMRERLGASARIVVPGIRRASDGAGDQQRTGTAREAARDGATHLVVGRPITAAADPAAVLGALMEEAECGADS